MKTHSSVSRRTLRGFSLVELLVVIAVIGLLAGMLIPAIATAKKKALIKRARVEMSDIRNAATTYMADYNGRMPLSSGASSAIGLLNPQPDYTFNDVSVPVFTPPPPLIGPPPPPLPVPHPAYVRDNSKLVAILADLQQYRNGVNTVNLNHARNPKRNPYLNYKDSAGDPANPESGVGLDGVYRDPWGYPYFITVDANYDGICHDALYRLNAVSGGGLAGTALTGAPGSDTWGVRGEVIIWSAGPDGLYQLNAPANDGVNRDNILSWWDRK